MVEKINPRQPVTPQNFNKLVDAFNRLNDISTSPPLELTRGGGRIQLRITEEGFLAAVTRRVDRQASSSSQSGLSSSSSGLPDLCSHAGNRYAYDIQQVTAADCGTWIYTPTGKSLLRVWEWNDNKVEVGTVVWVEPFGLNDYRFDYGGATQEDSSSSSGQSGSSGSSSSSGSGDNQCIDVITNIEYSATNCLLNFNTATLCIPPCVTVTYNTPLPPDPDPSSDEPEPSSDDGGE